jgi:hypothetical protein
VPEPLTIALGSLAVALCVVLVAIGRVTRLRRAIDDSAATVRSEEDHLERLRTASADSSRSSGTSTQAHEQVVDAADRLAAVRRLHAAQLRTWNDLGNVRAWRLLRPLTRWRPIDEQAGGAHSNPGRSRRTA